MIELIVLVVVLVGLTVIARSPHKKPETETPPEPPPSFWSSRTDWHRFDKPTYLRRGIALDLGEASTRRRRLPTRQVTTDAATRAERETRCHHDTGRGPPERLRSGARSIRR